MWQMSVIDSIYFPVKYTNLMKFHMCKFFASSFLFSLFSSSPSFTLFFLPTRVNLILKSYKFFIWSPLIPHVWFRAIKASEFMNFSRENNYLRAFFISSMLKRILQHDLGVNWSKSACIWQRRYLNFCNLLYSAW